MAEGNVFRRIALVSVLPLAWLVCAAAQAQTGQFGTWWVKFESSSVEGRLVACGLNFGALVQEKVQGQDAAILVTGLLFNQSLDDVRSVALKIGTGRLTGRGGNITEVPMRPQAAWLRSVSGRDYAANVVSSRPDEGPGELFVVLRSDDALGAGLRESLSAGRLSILYTRAAGTTPQSVPLELDVVSVDRTGKRARSRRAIEDFTKCNEALQKP